MATRFRRIVLKISGEALSGLKSGVNVIDYNVLNTYAKQIQTIRNEFQVDMGVVVGGGNIIRGRVAHEYGMDRVQADYMGMLATNINALAFQSALERHNIETRIMSAIKIEQACEFYIRRRALRHLEKKRVLIFSGGIGNPYLSTDTAASMRAKEIGADVLIKATRVNGIYDKDPEKNKNAKFIPKLTYEEAIKNKYDVMDTTAYDLCYQEKEIPIAILNINEKDGLYRFLKGEAIGSLIS